MGKLLQIALCFLAMFSIPDQIIGQAAAVFAALLWTLTSILFTAGGKRLGSVVVNAIRLPLAVIMLAVTHRVLTGSWVPHANDRQIIYLALSGIIGLAIGDQALFTSFLDIGPRLALLLMTSSPLFASFFGYLALGEKIHALGWVGMLLTIAGIVWVIMEQPAMDKKLASGGGKPDQVLVGKGDIVVDNVEAQTISRQDKEKAITRKHRTRGVFLAVFGSACQAGGLLLSKMGMGHGFMDAAQRMSPQSATLIRMFFAMIAIVPIVLVARMQNRKRLAAGLKSTATGSRLTGVLFVCMGAVVGPFLGVWMSLIASDKAPVGIAQTLLSLSPVFILPFAAFLYHERISLRTVMGVVVAVGGSALLFIKPA